MKLKEVVALTPISLGVILEYNDETINIKSPSTIEDFKEWENYEVEGIEVINNKLMLWIG